MKRKNYLIWMVILLALAFLLIPYAIKLLGIIFFPAKVTIWSQLELYLWCSVGFVAFFFLRRFLGSNLKVVETFSHELTHGIIALLFQRRIHSFNVGETGGLITTSGRKSTGIIPMTLSPYCLPIFSYLLLILRSIISFDGRPIFDMLIGMTLCFHFYCFKTQMGSHQTDITQFPLSFSYLYIFVGNLINFCVIWVAFFPGYNVFTSFWRMVTTIWGSILGLF